MKLYIKYIKIISLASVLSVLSGCNDFLDINQDVNNPLSSTPALLLPTVQTVIAEALGNGAGGMSDLTSQLVHQTVQRNASNFYFIGGNEFNISNAWPNLYAGALKDIDEIISIATEQESWHYLGIAQILRAYTYTMIVDLWGRAAYTEFGLGTENPFATFNEGDVIYADMLALIDEAKANLGRDVSVGVSNDLIYGGDIDAWIHLANSLKLKFYNQVRLTSLYNAADVAAIISEGEMLADVDEGFRLQYGQSNNPENRHPLFIQDYVQANANYIDPYFYLIMRGDPALPVLNPLLVGIEDPRIPYYFYNQIDPPGDNPQNPTTSAVFGRFLSIWFASLNIDPNEGFDQGVSQTLVGLYPAGGAYDDGSSTTAGLGANQNPGFGGQGYQRLYPYFAHLYTRAELSLTEGAPGDARQLFEDAMYASFDEVNDIASQAGGDVPQIDATEIDDYVASVLALYDAGNDATKLELILTEKWIASFGFSVDAYTDYRRTGYPLLFNPATDNNPFTILNRSYPVSIPYFINDLQINPNAPAQRNPATDKVFWDVN